MGDSLLVALTGALGLISAVAYVFGRRSGRKDEVAEQRRAKSTGEETAARLVEEARREVDNLRKGAVVAGKEEVLQLRESIDQEMRQRRGDVEREEKRVADREVVLDKSRESLEGREQEQQRRLAEIGRREVRSVEREQELERLVDDERRRLEQLAGLTAEAAKAELMRRLEDAAHADAASKLREIRESAKRNAEREAKKIVALAVQRVAAETTAETTV